jgi:hypothetical protein
MIPVYVFVAVFVIVTFWKLGNLERRINNIERGIMLLGRKICS